MAQRIPFQVAISDKLLLKAWFDRLTHAQQVALLAFYGCPLKDADLDLWSTLRGGAVLDDVGYPISVQRIPYEQRQYHQLVALIGRRAGKTTALAATVTVYEAMLGGHEDYAGLMVGKVACFLISQDLRHAEETQSIIRNIISTSPLLEKEVRATTADWITLKNGIVIGTASPTVKSVRGWAVPVVIMDEVGVWYKTVEAANPDYEVERAVRFSQIQFPHYKRIIISSPYIKKGLLYDRFTKYWQRPHSDMLVYYAPTAVVAPAKVDGRPFITRARLLQEREEDAEAFERESLARFVDALAGFLSPTLLEEARAHGVQERAPTSHHTYVAAMDPAFRRDAFAFTIGHFEQGKGFVQDVIRSWQAPSSEEKLNPVPILAEIAPLVHDYNVTGVASDQYQLESLTQLAAQHGITLYGVDFTGRSKAKIMGSLQQLVNQKRISLLDDSRQMQQLKELERRYGSLGNVQIAAPKGSHDDAATVLALCVHESLWVSEPKPEQPIRKEPTPYDLCMATIYRTNPLYQTPAQREQAWMEGF